MYHPEYLMQQEFFRSLMGCVRRGVVIKAIRLPRLAFSYYDIPRNMSMEFCGVPVTVVD